MSRQEVTRITPPRGDACQMEQPRSWYYTAFRFSVAEPTKRDKVAFVKPLLVVLNQWYDVMYRQPGVHKPPCRKAYSAAMEIAFENCFSSVFPNLCIPELVRL